MTRHLHYLRVIQISKKKWEWVCACGQASGAGPTEEACEASYSRHLLKASFKRLPRLY